MSNRSRRRARNQIEKAAVTAAQAQAAGGVTFTPRQVAALLDQSGAAGGQLARPLPRLNPQVPFGPGVPLLPAPLNPPRPDTGRPEPRRYEYPVAANLPGFGDRLVPWKVLRDAADQIGLFRRCIEIRKAEVSTLEWDIVISDHAIERALQTASGTSRRDVEQEMRKRLDPEVARCVQFWERPDRRNGYDFIAWSKALLEEHFVLDAVAVYPRQTYGGDLFSFEVLDGSTIKPLLDEYGGRPLPPNPAYQQVLYGFPRGEYIADIDDQGHIRDAYPADRLIYRVSNVRTWTPYGYSAVEQALDDGDLYLRRHAWLKAEYTDGVMPAGWLLAGQGQADWSAAELAEYERALNDYYAGSTQTRQRFRILPYGMTPDQRADLGEKYRPDYDLFLLKLVASHFDTTLAELGFTEQGGLGSTGWHEGQADVQDRKGTQPTLRWLQSLVTDISRTFLGMPQELEFRILGLESEDADAVDEVADRRVKSGRMTLNEDRDRQGLPRYTFPEADMPMIVTGRGVEFIEGASAVAPGHEIEPPAGVPEGGEPADGGPDESAPPTADSIQPPQADQPSEAAKTELVAYRRWAAKRGSRPARPFRFEHLTKAEAAAAGVNLDAVEFLAKAGGAGPKARPRHWPGWEQDLAVAKHWAPAISQALTGAIPAQRIADDWLSVRKVDAGSLANALAWVQAYGLDLVGALTSVLVGLWTDGYLVGSRSADTLIAHRGGQVSATVDWDTWTPGDTAAARELLGADDAGEGLSALLNNSRITIDGIAATKYTQLAEILAAGLENGDAPTTVAKAIDDLVDDPQWAYMVAVTETTRASSAAALGRYRDNGIEAVEWMTAMDQRVCNPCHDNEDAGPIPLGSLFPSGDDAPPAHPVCRCAPAPSLLSLDELTTADLTSTEL